MVWDGRHPDDEPIDFFVSYSPRDEPWAAWIAWVLESSGYRTMIQAWDFVPGTNFIDFMDRGLSQAAAVVAVLSPNYLTSTYGRLEWQTAVRGAPYDPGSRLITVRVEECELQGILATITFLDLVPVTDPDMARQLLIERIGHALAGRAKPAAAPAYPPQAGASAAARSWLPGSVTRHHPRLGGPPPADYPPDLPVAGNIVRVLHIAGPRFTAGSDPVVVARQLLDRLTHTPDVVAVSGGLTENGRRSEFDPAVRFLGLLRDELGLMTERFVVVPGAHDVSLAMAEAYFHHCAAEETTPRPPFWPKWRHFLAFTEKFRHHPFTEDRPWSFAAFPDLRIAVAGFNSTMAISHRPEDRYGFIGKAQLTWFTEQLALLGRPGWIRLGVIRHVPASGETEDFLHDGGAVGRALGGCLDVLLHGPGGKAVLDMPTVDADEPGHANLIRIFTAGDSEPRIDDELRLGRITDGR